MVTLFRFILIIPIFFPIAIASNADDKGPKIEQLSMHFRMEKPDGKGPFPAVILVPGCKGFESKNLKSQYNRVQAILGELGFVTLRVDYLAVRNASSCLLLSPEDAAGDIVRVTNYLRQQDYIKKNALNVIGWSFGGASAFQALMETSNRTPAKVDAVIAYYPACSFLNSQDWSAKASVLALFGTFDNVAPFSRCENLFSGLTGSDKVTVRIYKEANHCFDNPDLPPGNKWSTVGYNETAAKTALMRANVVRGMLNSMTSRISELP